MRNAARIAIVADVIARFKIDLLLMMETGTDVGTATTRIAGRVAEKLNERDGWDPFVSPPTGALPEVKAVYDDHSLGRPSGLKAVSLRTLFDVYVVTPRYDRVPTAVTGQQISDAWAALWGASPWASRFLRGDDVSAENSVVRGAPSFELLAHIVRRINDTAKQVGSVIGGSLEQDVDTVIRVMSDSVNELANGHLQTSASDLAYAILSARDAIDMLAEIEVEASFQQDIIDEGVAWLQAVELMALFLIKAASGAIPTSGLEGRVFRSDSSQGNRIPLAVFLCTGAGRVTLKARDRKQGPADGTLDNDVLLGALQRIGAIERHIETYGVVYRQPFPGATQALLGRGVLAHGFSGGVDEAAARYGIVQAPLSKGAFSVQQAGGLLNWRSALQITVPASTAVALPLVVYHTRYSGTAELKKYDTTLTAEENTILARCMSVEMMAAAVLPGDSKLGPPLIVGDFNVPDAFLNKQAVPVSKDKRVREAHRRRDELRLRFVGEMARRGYLRHSLAGKPDDGYPPTTLKAFSTITRGEDAGSEPYDGTYQPFDYGRGGASPSSGVVSVRGLLDGSVLQEKITGIPSQAADGRTIDPDAGEAEDTSKDVQDEDTMREDPSKDSEWTVGEAIAVEVGRVYRGILRRIYRAIEDLKPWMDAIHRKRPSDELIEKLREIGEVYTGFEQHVAKRVEWFARSCVAGETGTWLTASRSDSLVDWQKLFGDAAQLQERDEIRGGVAGLAELAGEVQVQLTALETQMEVRRLVAYRAVVSDHLPQIIEIDMQPA